MERMGSRHGDGCVKFRNEISTMSQRNGVILCLVIGLGAWTAVTVAQEDDQGAISAALAPRAEALIMARCSVCHSPDLISQQRLSEDRWAATVQKMKQWGAEMNDDEMGLLVRYLSARYHRSAPLRLPPLFEGSGQSELPMPDTMREENLPGVAARGAHVFEHNCQACHGAQGGGGVGPTLAKNPILKYEDLFWETVLHGRGPMPGWSSVLTHQDIADVYAWLLTK